jgi:uncharacterized lipoprotein YajG
MMTLKRPRLHSGATVLVAIVLLTGCTSYKTALINKDGAITHCNQSGFGVISGPIASSQHNDCVNNAHAQGYAEIPDQKK